VFRDDEYASYHPGCNGLCKDVLTGAWVAGCLFLVGLALYAALSPEAVKYSATRALGAHPAITQPIAQE
jgi:hypothetical protein